MTDDTAKTGGYGGVLTEENVTCCTTMKHLAELQRDWVVSMPWREKSPLEGLALIASEVGEAVNECRGSFPTPELGAELADIVLRVFDLAEMLGINIEQECRTKMAHNIAKGNLKGRGV